MKIDIVRRKSDKRRRKGDEDLELRVTGHERRVFPVSRKECARLRAKLNRMKLPDLSHRVHSGVRTLASSKDPRPAPDITIEGISPHFCFIPSGAFLMGSPETEAGRWLDEGPQHQVALTHGFLLADTPCTQGLWRAVMGNNPSRFRGKGATAPLLPVEQVSWYDAIAFCNALSRKVGVEEAYRISGEQGTPGTGGYRFDHVEYRNSESPQGPGFRLPTEAEWEYACRAGTTTATWLGDLDILGMNNAPLLDEIAWYGGNCGLELEVANGQDTSDWPEKQHTFSKGGTHAVKKKAPNPLGLFDMLGNVWEWCFDVYAPYSVAAQTDPLVSKGGSLRVIRGGSWLSYAGGVRAAYRSWGDPAFRGGDLGFRLARGQSAQAKGEAPAEPKAEPGRRRERSPRSKGRQPKGEGR